MTELENDDLRDFQIIYTEEEMQCRFLECFYRYGTKYGRNSFFRFKLITAMTDINHEIFMTFVSSETDPKTKDINTEYIFIYRDASYLVRCTYAYNGNEIIAMECANGRIPLPRTELLRWIHSWGRVYMNWQKNIVKMSKPLLDGRNMLAIQKHLLKNQEKWIHTKELLSNDWHFIYTNEEQQHAIWTCVMRYADKEASQNEYGGFHLTTAMTDSQESFLMTGCFYLPDGIKRINEPDDYEYAVIADGKMGVVRGWHGWRCAGIGKISGDISFSESTIVDMMLFHEYFLYRWERYQDDLNDEKESIYTRNRIKIKEFREKYGID